MELEEIRKEANAMASDRMQGKRYAAKPYSPTKQKQRTANNRSWARRQLEENGEEIPDNLKKQGGIYVPIVYSGSARDDKLAEGRKLDKIRRHLNKKLDKENKVRGKGFTQVELDVFKEQQGSAARHYTDRQGSYGASSKSAAAPDEKETAADSSKKMTQSTLVLLPEATAANKTKTSKAKAKKISGATKNGKAAAESKAGNKGTKAGKQMTLMQMWK